MLATHCNRSKTRMKNIHPNVMICSYNNNNNLTFPSMTNQKWLIPYHRWLRWLHPICKLKHGAIGRFFESLKEPLTPCSLNDLRIKEPSVLVLWKKFWISKTPENQGGVFFSWTNRQFSNQLFELFWEPCLQAKIGSSKKFKNCPAYE